ncbi:MAG: MurR/RpiR family transcriptional regulator [Cohaesibacter sp.]|nr:MurR/RpiR family transcriptional regulator [Cohaesibacter sp.]
MALKDASLQERIAASYSQLSDKLRQAADYVIENPVDVATRSLRSISAASNLAPATFTRLSRSLGFSSYEELRELCRHAFGQRHVPFSEKADRLQMVDGAEKAIPFLRRQTAACIDNLNSAVDSLDPDRLEDVADFLASARRVVLFGAYGSTGIVEYFAYLANFFASNWKVAGRMGASLSTSIVDSGKEDAFIILTKPPFARRSIMAARLASEAGSYVVVITDSYHCPALKYASAHFIVPTDSPQFFSSYVTTLMLIETLVGMLVSRAGPKARRRIEDVEARNRMLGEFWED